MKILLLSLSYCGASTVSFTIIEYKQGFRIKIIKFYRLFFIAANQSLKRFEYIDFS